ncbi:nitrate reductase [Salinispirillum sp. LH 10-3-1]|uniref:Nitrate reductase n=1 Tax=Salinispirillum sp. LH 10-3-1 TaxID=2952525 RepID=A0AB38YJN7_9GAMM
MKKRQETTCAYCGVGCGVSAMVHDDRVIAVEGSTRHPANRGRLCVKGSALHETLDASARLLAPQVYGETVDWDRAISAVAKGFADVIRRHGPDSVAFYVSGQLLTEDYYVANKLLKGFIGTSNIDTNSRLCMSSAVAAQKRAFGSDTVPANYEDLDEADLLVLTGSNAAWTHPVLFQRMQAARTEAQKKGRKLKRMVVIDPRSTATAESADLHLALKPGTDAVLFNGLLVWLHRQDLTDSHFIERHTQGFTAALNTAERTAGSLKKVAAACDVPIEQVETFYQWAAQSPKMVTFYSMGINQSSSGVDKAHTIINLHLATGRIGKPGASPFSITGQPNAMGGREVGGLANQLAAHMNWDSPDDVNRVERFWRAPNMARGPGLAATDLFEAVGQGKIKAIWIMATNPVVSMPDADRVRAVLSACELVVVSDCMQHTDTLDMAHIKLPATGWSEKDGTVTNSERRISRQRALVKPMGQAKHDWWIITQVARAMGFAAGFPYQQPVDIFREHAQLSAYENNGSRDFDISLYADITPAEYDAMVPLQWPITQNAPMGTARLFGDGRFYTPEQSARFFPIVPQAPRHLPRANSSVSDSPFEFLLNTGRLRDQWHTMTRTGLADRLQQHMPEPRVYMHPDDAVRLQVSDQDWVQLDSARVAGEDIKARVVCSTSQRRGELFMPIHWTAQNSSHGRVGRLIPAHVDPISFQPELKHAVVQVQRWQPAQQGYIWLREALAEPPWDAWLKRTVAGVTVYQFAHSTLWRAATDLPQLMGGALLDEPMQVFEDLTRHSQRLVWGTADHRSAIAWVGQTLPEPDSRWVAECLKAGELNSQDRRDLLAGRSGGQVDPGPLVCSCHQVGEYTIRNAMRDDGINTVEGLGKQLKCGTQCGSCIPDLKRLIVSDRAVDAA